MVDNGLNMDTILFFDIFLVALLGPPPSGPIGSGHGPGPDAGRRRCLPPPRAPLQGIMTETPGRASSKKGIHVYTYFFLSFFLSFLLVLFPCLFLALKLLALFVVFWVSGFQTLVLWCSGALVLWCCGAVVLWCCGAVALWRCGAVVLWCCGAVVLLCLRHDTQTQWSQLAQAHGHVI